MNIVFLSPHFPPPLLSVLPESESVPGVFSSALGDIGYIFRSKSLDQIMEIGRFIHQTQD
jgi:hypothetical protein